MEKPFHVFCGLFGLYGKIYLRPSWRGVSPFMEKVLSLWKNRLMYVQWFRISWKQKLYLRFCIHGRYSIVSSLQVDGPRILWVDGIPYRYSNPPQRQSITVPLQPEHKRCRNRLKECHNVLYHIKVTQEAFTTTLCGVCVGSGCSTGM